MTDIDDIEIVYQDSILLLQHRKGSITVLVGSQKTPKRTMPQSQVPRLPS